MDVSKTDNERKKRKCEWPRGGNYDAFGSQKTVENEEENRGLSNITSVNDPEISENIQFESYENPEGAICDYDKNFYQANKIRMFQNRLRTEDKQQNSSEGNILNASIREKIANWWNRSTEGLGYETSWSWNKSRACSSNSGSVAKNRENATKARKTNDGVPINHDEGASEPIVFSLTDDPPINTLGDSLNYFGMSTLLEELEKSLQDVKRNKKSNDEHEMRLKKADKAMQKLSFTFHPDRVSNRGGSDLEVATAQKLQSALNASRVVLKILTEVFLDDTDTDYKYEYFAMLEINSLVNENEINHRISEVLYKVSQLSEIKRLSIIREIRNFLSQSQACVKSYLGRNKNDFMKYRDYALHHLKKCIEGYETLEKECSTVEEECRDEGQENIRSVILKVAKQSSAEVKVLRRLENVARRSLQGSFEIFTTDEPIDDYFILPFVHYVNVFLMCSVMLGKEKKSSWFSLNYSVTDPCFQEDPISILFANAYYLASYFNDRKQSKREAEIIMRSSGFKISKEDVISEFDKIFKKIVEFLENEFRLDAYTEGKSNRAQLTEKLSKLEEAMADFREQEKGLREQIRMREKNDEENLKKYRHAMEESERIEKMVRKNLEQSKKLSENVREFPSNYTPSVMENKRIFGKEGEENRSESDELGKNDIKEMEEKIQAKCEENRKIREQLSEILLSAKNMSEGRGTFPNDSSENWRQSDQATKVDAEEMKDKLRDSFEQNKKMREQLSELFLQSKQNIPESRSVESKGNWENIAQVMKEDNKEI